MMENLGFLVNKPGMLSLIQDKGRYGAFNLGLTNGGPIDRTAFHWANRLCDNELPLSALEISIGGLVLTAQVNTTIAITGALMPVTINGMAKPLWRTHHVKAGDVIEFGYASEGMRSYLAVSGGFKVKQSFGSTATVCREHIGGLSGAKLVAGDVLICKNFDNHKALQQNFLLPERYWPNYTKDIVLRTIPGYQQKHFSSYQQRLFYSCEYRVSQRCDRMGYRLEGQKIACDIDGILSEGICLGAVQIPADGQPIVLMNDRQTIGGYPKIGSVISLDTAKLGQLSPGAKVHFEPISMEKAHNLYHLALSQFSRTVLITCD